MERLAKKFSARIEFAFLYCQEAHPQSPGEPDASQDPRRPPLRGDNYTERQRVAQWVQDEAHLQRRILVDEFGGESAFGYYFSEKLDHPLVVVDIDGKVAGTMAWTAVEVLEPFLDQLLGHSGEWTPALVLEAYSPERASGPNFAAMYQRQAEAGKKSAGTRAPLPGARP